MRALDGGCTSPVAAYAQIEGDVMSLTGLNIDNDGSPFTMEIIGSATDGEEMGAELAAMMCR